MKLLILLLLTSFNITAATTDFEAHFFINGKKANMADHTMVKPNTPTLIEVYFTDPRTGETYKDFKVMHGKYMHMVIANDDLSVFKHIHPYLDPTTGRFSITLNLPYADPDNQDVITSLNKPGMYMIMSDVIVKNVGMRMDHTMVHVMGQNQNIQLVEDHEENGEIIKYFKRENESTPTYKGIFRKRFIQGCSGNIVEFEVEMFHFVNNAYEPLLDFQPWLDEAGHAVWISEGYMRHMHGNMPFAHMHSSFILDDDEDPTNDRVYDHILRFNFHDLNTMLSGKQKMWIQFKHKDIIMKIPFIFNYQRKEPRQC